MKALFIQNVSPYDSICSNLGIDRVDFVTPIRPDGLTTLIEQVAASANGDIRHWHRAAKDARQAGRRDEALALLDAAAERFPDAPQIPQERAALAEAERDLPEAERCWRRFMELSPGTWWGSTHLAQVLRQQNRLDEADAVLAEATRRFPNESPVFMEYAQIAERRADWPEAASRWAVVMQRFPDQWNGLGGMARALREQGQPENAKALLLQALERFPTSSGPVHDLGRLAESRREWLAAERWWRIWVLLEPNIWWGYASLANALREQGRVQEASALLTEQCGRLPQEKALWIEHARLADRSKDWAAASKRWAEVVRRFPDDFDGYSGLAQALRSLGRASDARGLLTAAIPRFRTLPQLWHELARLAEAASDWPLATTYWRMSIELDGSVWWSRTGLANALHIQGETATAKALLSETTARFPREPGPAIALARLIEGAGDWDSAYQQWRPLLTAFPSDWAVHQGVINAAFRSRRQQEAETLLAPAQARFPAIPWFFVEPARQADARRDWERADALWRDAEQRFPHDVDIRMARINTLREAGDLMKAAALLAETAERFPASSPVLRQQALLLEAQENWAEAADAWLRLLDAEPNHEMDYIRCANAFHLAGKTDDAAGSLERGCRVLGNRPALLRELGLIAERNFDLAGAVRRYRAYVAACPHEVDAVTRLANALASDGKLSEGEAVLREAIAARPDNAVLAIAYAYIAQRAGVSGDGPFLERARTALERFPDEADAYRAYADAQVRLRDLDEAEAALRKAHSLFPENMGIARRLAGLLSQRGKWDDAITLYSRLASTPPIDVNVLLEATNTLVSANRLDEAEAMATRAIAQFPAFGLLYVARIDIAIAAGRLDDAASLWQTVQSRFSASIGVRRMLFERRTQLLDMGVHLPDVRAPVTADADDGVKVEDIIGEFESLGGAGIGCEFGQFQRFNGAEPLGLLRWTEMQPNQLADALEARFEGVGRADQTILEVLGDESQEYTASDKRFGMRMHTFVPARNVPYDKMFVQICRRLAFLSNKLREDLESGTKIFVYKNAMRALTQVELDRIHTAIRSYGDTTLLYVTREDADHPFPTVVSPKPGLLIGYIDRFELLDNGTTGSLPTLSWAAIVRPAYRLWKAWG